MHVLCATKVLPRNNAFCKEETGMDAQKIILATRNQGKVRELRSLLSDFGFGVEALPENFPDIEETGTTFEQNAVLKARSPSCGKDVIYDGSFTGTVNRLKDPEVLGRLRSWLTAHQISDGTDNYSGTDVSGYEGAARGDYTAYLDAAILPLVLETGHLGTRSAGTVTLLTVLALALVLLALLLGVSVLLGLWEKPTKAAIREYGLKRLAGDYDLAGIAGDSLRIGNDFLWVFGPLFTHIYEIREVVWLYPRSRRLEGGKKRWSLVLKTEHGEEDAAPLDSEWAVEQAIQTVIARGWPITVGFDREKQKLYKKDLAAFKGRVRNGTI